MVKHKRLSVIGCGEAYESIVADYQNYPLDVCEWAFRPIASVTDISASAEQLLKGLDHNETRLFVAVDGNALNYARLELYGAARVKGYKFVTLVHNSVRLTEQAKIGENVWIGPNAYIAPGAAVGSNVMLGACSRIDSKAEIGSHVWIGPGATISRNSKIGNHTLIGADVSVGESLTIGRHCMINRPGCWQTDMPNGRFWEPGYSEPAQIVGSGYSWNS